MKAEERSGKELKKSECKNDQQADQKKKVCFIFSFLTTKTNQGV